MANSPPGNAPPAADPVTDAEFAALMAQLGPWERSGEGGRRVAVAVSGGPDSLCLALLTHAWGNAAAIIVDHGLRPASSVEAAWTAEILRSRGLPAQVVTLTDLPPGPGIAARAREARYAALTRACQRAGMVDLLLGHHAGDQAETRLMRERRGSGVIGLAGMAAVAERRLVRLVRPLLTIPPERLRLTLQCAGQAWVDDPSNADPRATRTRLRTELAGSPIRMDPHAASRRARGEAAAAEELGARAAIYPEGCAIVSPGPISAMALGMLLQSIGGHAYPPSDAALAQLAGALRPATLAGVRVLPAGHLGAGWLLVREAAALAPARPVHDGVTWDGRFQVTGTPVSTSERVFTIGALGEDRAQFRGTSRWPAVVLQTLPAIRCNNLLSAVPHLAYGSVTKELERVRLHRLGPPARGAGFLAI